MIERDQWGYYMPTKIVFGSGVISKLKDIVDRIHPTMILLVTGKNAMQRFGIIDKIKKLLKSYNTIIYNKVEPNPGITTIKNGIEILKENGCDLVIGLGGGSAIDAAKAIAVLSKNDGEVEDYLYSRRKIVRRGVPIIAIPSTAGTSSEITKFSVITLKNTKKTISHDFMYPNFAIIDPILTLTVPRFITASTGIDAFCHAIEAYWAKNSNPISDIFALRAIQLIFDNLRDCCNNLKDIKLREKIAMGSLFAGLAFGNTRSTAIHSVSYPITAIFDVPHGQACALTLPLFIKFNSKVMKERILDIMNIIGAKTINEGIEKINELMSDIGLATKLSEVGINRGDIDIIVRNGFTGNIDNNPRELNAIELRKMLMEIL